MCCHISVMCQVGSIMYDGVSVRCVPAGEVPKWLRGALIRNGPGRLQVGDYQYNHVFDGSALLHRLVSYKNILLY